MKKKILIALVLLLAVAAGLAVGLWQIDPGLFGRQTPTTTQAKALDLDPEALAQARQRVAALEREAAMLRQRLAQAEGLAAEADRLKGELARAQRELEQVRAELAACRKQPNQAMDQGHVSKTIYYAPGRSSLDKKGLGIVKESARQIRAARNPEVRVEGHADTMPMSPATRKKYHDNLGLSAVRSLEVARELFNQGVPMEKVIVVGYGTTQPMKGPKVKGQIINNRRCIIRYYEKD